MIDLKIVKFNDINSELIPISSSTLERSEFYSSQIPKLRNVISWGTKREIILPPTVGKIPSRGLYICPAQDELIMSQLLQPDYTEGKQTKCAVCGRKKFLETGGCEPTFRAVSIWGRFNCYQKYLISIHRNLRKKCILVVLNTVFPNYYSFEIFWLRMNFDKWYTGSYIRTY